MELYHYTTWPVSDKHIGRLVKTSWPVSHYWQSKLAGGWADDYPELPQVVTALAELGFDVSAFAELLKHGKYAAELLKEFVFEEVRSRQFPACPSRTKCLYAFSIAHDPDNYAAMLGFDSVGRNLLRIEPLSTTRMHFADTALLNCNLSTYPQLVQRATEYWGGSSPDSASTEVLIEGQFRIVAVK